MSLFTNQQGTPAMKNLNGDETRLILGVMSGTSMDGVDLSLCSYTNLGENRYDFNFIVAQTCSYPKDVLELLKNSKELKPTELFALDKHLGTFIGTQINRFLQDNTIAHQDVDAIASHGHTVYHQPENGFTVQIGCGDTIASITGIQVINDFRQKDVIAGGQGAPLVPIGDIMLFNNLADAYLNIGGFVNMTIPSPKVIAFDICPGNLPLNEIASEFGKEYDENGEIARTGVIDSATLDFLNALPYYRSAAPKSLGTEWLEREFLPLLRTCENPQNRMATCVAHIATQIIQTCDAHRIKSLYITGGGAFNNYLIDQIRENSIIEIIIPDKNIISYKEAIIFGFLGVRFLEKKHNALASVTGASHNVIGGVLHLP